MSQQALLDGILAASAKISGIDLQATGLRDPATALAEAVQQMMACLTEQYSQALECVQWINIYADMRRDGRFPADVVDVLDTCHAAVGFGLQQGAVNDLHTKIIAHITKSPGDGLTDLLAREDAPIESVISLGDQGLVLSDPAPGMGREVRTLPETVSWYGNLLFPEGTKNRHYVHIKHPTLSDMRRTLGLNCCGAYLMSTKEWPESRGILYPPLRMVVLEFGALISNWLAEELQNEHRRQREVAEMVHRRAARATREFSDAARSLTMLRDLVAPEVAMLSDARELRKFFVTDSSQRLNERVKLPCAHDWEIDDDGKITCTVTTVVPDGSTAKDVCASQVIGILLSVIGEAEGARMPLCRFARRILEGHNDDHHRLVAAMMTFLPILKERLDAATDDQVMAAFRFVRRCFHEPYKPGGYKLNACCLFFFAHSVWLGRRWKWGENALIKSESPLYLPDLIASGKVEVGVSSSRGIDTVVGLHHVVNCYGGLNLLELNLVENSIRMELVDVPDINSPSELARRVMEAYGAMKDGETTIVGDHTSMFLQLMGAKAAHIGVTSSPEGEWTFQGTEHEAEADPARRVTISFKKNVKEFQIKWGSSG